MSTDNTTTNKLLSGLNREQQEAAVYTGGDSLILAGAGSGKTRVLTTKIAYLLSKNPALHPSRILALTFTRKAAEEMRGRVSQLVGRERSSLIQMGTFHSVFARWLRGYAERLGYTPNYIIYDTTDSKNVVKGIIKEMNLDDKMYTPDKIYSQISNRKNDGISPTELANSKDWGRRLSKLKIEKLPAIYSEYISRCRRNDAMDFDDLLLNMYRLLSSFPDLADQLRSHFRFILVDEYQDTNFIQDAIIQKLKGPETDITVVGDDAQSIYSFRGAVIDNIIRFNSRFIGARIFKLTKNYRSTGNIVNLANGIIRNNSQRIPKEVVSVGSEGEKSLLFRAFTGRGEAERVVSQIDTLHANGVPFSDIAILYRTNVQSRLFEDELRRAKIPNKIYGGISFYERKEVKDVMAYVRLVINPKDDEAFTRIYNFPSRGIGEVTFAKIQQLSRESGHSYLETASDRSLLSTLLNAGTISKVSAFASLIAELKSEKESRSLTDFVELLVQKSGFRELYGDDSIDSRERLSNIDELLGSVSEYEINVYQTTTDTPTIEHFVQEMALLTDQDRQNNDGESVSLMTMHGSKGLEFSYVFLPGLEDEIIPSQRSLKDGNEEEERRLFYVAITRAKKRCIMSYAESRPKYGVPQAASPSRFLGELDSELIEDTSGLLSGGLYNRMDSFGDFYFVKPVTHKTSPNTTSSVGPNFKSLGSRKKQVSSISNQSVDVKEYQGFKIGDRVSHSAFGIGTVVEFEDSVSGKKVGIEFDDTGRKNLILKFAKLTHI